MYVRGLCPLHLVLLVLHYAPIKNCDACALMSKWLEINGDYGKDTCIADFDSCSCFFTMEKAERAGPVGS